MSNHSHIPGGNFSEFGPTTGRKAIIMMGGLALTFAGFYTFLDRKDRNRRERGDFSGYEHAMLHTTGFSTSSGMPGPTRTFKPTMTREQRGDQHLPRGHPNAGPYNMDPSPQRPRGDGSTLVYTKVPPGVAFLRAKGVDKDLK
ncbi:hypothetical protein CYLTODRAFT_408716 [Cylindrobasidium torrendii FP15055 ss-10]|uniref:Uncharacterized protein n=1 Tax=Cylindrobasidium torrendii FP15055 ss-10 TaxID=1314674 RepID=A0A0D7BJV5_9AGAR|nr:hypothetical protein CYLTODRAFT_408716 [Cylindrobasidium torrendii FP15055 ss-10]